MSKKTNTEKILIIVESPNKVKTISGILKNAGYSKAVVMASVGHIMALSDGGPAYNSGIYPKQKFKMNLTIAEGKQKVVDDIIQQAKVADKIYIGTDQDREGFVIGWSLIKFCKLPIEKCYRIVMHEITPKAVIHALENPVAFDDNIVNAGLTRMMIDKLIGYGLSPLAKKYLRGNTIKTNYDRIIGKHATVTKTITEDLKGEVKVMGNYWSASSLNNEVIEEGLHVEILTIEGNHVVVRKI